MWFGNVIRMRMHSAGKNAALNLSCLPIATGSKWDFLTKLKI